ncbi:MAG: hydrogenase expression/formation protein HypE [Spirochaetota bacterium]
MKNKENILLAHGSGGRQSNDLIESLFKKHFSNDILNQGDDSANIKLNEIITNNNIDGSIAFTTDTFTVSPIFFPGGNIGDLAINGTVNDLSASGATPLYLSAGFILEEGFPLKDLDIIVSSMAYYSDKASVKIVTGDTKVVNKGQCDKIFINTSGIGYIPSQINISGANAKPGNAVIISGSIADHGVAVLSKREGLQFESNIESDSYPLNNIVKAVLDKYPDKVRVMRDPTRGGIATTLNEIAKQSNTGIRLFEDMIPIKEEVNAMCEILGLEPMYIANEGKMLFICEKEIAEDIISILKGFNESKEAAVIGEITDDFTGKVTVKTSVGGERFVDMLYGETLPRIC